MTIIVSIIMTTTAPMVLMSRRPDDTDIVMMTMPDSSRSPENDALTTNPVCTAASCRIAERSQTVAQNAER